MGNPHGREIEVCFFSLFFYTCSSVICLDPFLPLSLVLQLKPHKRICVISKYSSLLMNPKSLYLTSFGLSCALGSLFDWLLLVSYLQRTNVFLLSDLRAINLLSLNFYWSSFCCLSYSVTKRVQFVWYFFRSSNLMWSIRWILILTKKAYEFHLIPLPQDKYQYKK